MKILVIHGSMRKGNTYRLAKEIMRYLSEKKDVEITEIGVAELNLPFCVSCHMCLQKGENYCPHNEKLNGVRAALLNCDGVIVSGTTYVWALNAAMKNLLDHFAYLFHRPVLFGKQGMVIATSAGNGEKSVAKYLKSVIAQWGINGAMIVTQNTKERSLQSDGDGLSAKETEKFDAAAEKFYGSIKSKKHKSPCMKTIAVHNAFRAMALSEFSESECDKQFWCQEGFCNKPYPIKIGIFKYIAGAFIYNAAKKATDIVGGIYKKRNKK